jgi:hypothetical protein
LAKLLKTPQEIKVATGGSGAPLSIRSNSIRGRVTAIYEQWKLADQWWGQEIERHYFRVETSGGIVCDIYRDTGGDRWYLSKIHD